MEDAHDFPNDMRQPAQHSFLVRFWRSTPNGSWHVTLQRTTREPAMHFAGVDLLFAFLLMQLGDDAPFLNPGVTDQQRIDAPDAPHPDTLP